MEGAETKEVSWMQVMQDRGPKNGYYAVPDFRANGIISHKLCEKWYAFGGS